MTGRAVTMLLALALLGLAEPAAIGATPAAAGERWIVQLAPGTDPDGFIGPARIRLGLRPGHVFRHAVRGFSATLSSAQREELLRDPRVAAVEPDHPIRSAFQPQELQPGVKRVGAPQNPDRAHQPLDVDIAILDTGIQPDHPDLNVVGGYNCTAPGQTETGRQQPSAWRDGGFGHGTHVAGIAAARDNHQGVAGVAAGARLWSIKVLDHDGLGYWSWIICGLDWVARQRDGRNSSLPLVEVANMSLAGGGTDDGDCGYTNFDLLHQAVCRVDRAGVTVVAAAGNESAGTHDYVPAAYDEVIAVSAMGDYDGQPGGLAGKPLSSCAGRDDAFAAFSNHGRDVDLIAPGVCVLSTLPDSRYGRMSGTSMAAPHVSGGAALFHLWERRAGRGHPRPQDVRMALVSTGVLDWRTGTDGDGHVAGSAREPLLNVAGFNLAPTFHIGATPQVQRRDAGQVANYDVWVARLGGFTGAIELRVAGLPEGASWSEQPDPVGTGSDWRRIAVQLPSSGLAASHPLDIAAISGSTEQRVRVLLDFEGSVPAPAGPPAMKLRSGVQSGTVALPVLIRWPAVPGATRYALQASRDGGAWQEVALPNPGATKVRRGAWPGSSYRYRVRALSNGSWGAWSLGAISVAVPRYAPYDGVRLSGSWASASSHRSYSGLPVYSKQRGARATLAFTGRSVSWIAARGPRRGRARVFVDGTRVATIDLYARRGQSRRVVFSRSWAQPGSHTIEIRVLGTSGRPRVDVDALVVIQDR